MPFVPLTPEEKKQYKPPCFHPQHYPPSHIVIKQPTKYVCSACGKVTMIIPPTVMW